MKLGINFYVDFIALVGLWFSVLYVLISSTTTWVSWKNLKENKIEEMDVSYKYGVVAAAYIIGYINWVLISN